MRAFFYLDTSLYLPPSLSPLPSELMAVLARVEQWHIADIYVHCSCLGGETRTLLIIIDVDSPCYTYM